MLVIIEVEGEKQHSYWRRLRCAMSKPRECSDCVVTNEMDDKDAVEFEGQSAVE